MTSIPHTLRARHGHRERHRAERIGWLRAAVLGANDGIVSTASLVVGVAAASGGRAAVLVAGVAGLVAGAMSMAAGEYVSVRSQADSDAADLARERAELAADTDGAEQRELAAIYVKRGLEPKLAEQVAAQLMAADALAAHARDELGITERAAARPVQAALASAASFAAGAFLPLVAVALAPARYIAPTVAVSSLLFLAALGALAAQAGGASRVTGAVRVTFWGAAAMAATAAVGALFGTAVA
jgi:VIT1/CCC1 family predicted Fe2+/Mn2+ transporter